MTRKRILILVVVVLVAVGGVVAAREVSPALSMADACRGMLERTEGYGPWKLQPIAVGPSLPRHVAIYFDGYNIASCHAKQIGPLWVVDSIGQTLVACGLRLGDAAQECPRRAYGVTP